MKLTPPPITFRTPALAARIPVVIALLLTIAIPGCSKSDGPADPSAKASLPTIEAEVLTVAPQPWPRMIRSQGSLTADQVAVVGARVEGRVETVHVDLGDAVTANQPLVSLRRDEFQYRVEQAEAALLQSRSAVGLKPGDPVSKLNPENAPPVVEQRSLWSKAKADVERADQLLARNTITGADHRQYVTTAEVAEARYNAAMNSVREKIAQIGVREAELALAREAFEDAIVLAPFDGRVQVRSISPGAYVRVGDPLITLVKTDILRYRGMIPERYALVLDLGQEVQLSVESIPSPLTVKVTRISPALDLSSRALVYEAAIDNSSGGLRTGLFAEARIVVDETATAIVIPRTALIEFAGAEKVWKVVGGETQEQEVLTGERRPEGIEILQGLDEGDQILADAALGRPAKIKPIPQAARPETTSNSPSPTIAAEDEEPPATAAPEAVSE